MLKNLVICSLLVGCATTSKSTSQKAEEVGALVREDTVENEESPYVYLLIPSQELLIKEYDFQRTQALLNLDIAISEERLCQVARESAASQIAGTLDQVYGNKITGEYLPISGIIILTSQVPVDLNILKGLIDVEKAD